VVILNITLIVGLWTGRGSSKMDTTLDKEPLVGSSVYSLYLELKK
jgi:hypothetical protein